MSVWISIAPLLGLGTVIGMVKTFRSLWFWNRQSKSDCEGISVALLTTQAGLIAAFPSIIFHNYLRGKKNDLVSKILKDCEQITSKTHSLLTGYYSECKD